MIVNNSNFRKRNYSNKVSGLGLYDPTFLYSAPSGLINYANPITSSPSSSSGPASYVAPTLLGAPACSSGDPWVANSSACIQLLLSNQQKDMSANLDANRAVFLQNCNRDWLMNDQRYSELKMERPRNDCSERSFGQTPTTLFANANPGIDWSNVPHDLTQVVNGGIPPVNVNMNANQATQVTQVTANKTKSQSQQMSEQVSALDKVGSGNFDISSISNLTSSFGGDVSVLGFDIPIWAIGAVVIGGGIFLASRSGH